MSRRQFLLAAFGFALVCAPARAADEPKDVLARAIKAHGGVDFLGKNKAMRVKTKGKIEIPGLGETEFTEETALVIPGKFRDTLELKIMGKTLSVLTLVNGDKISLEVDGKDTKADDRVKESLRDAEYVMEIGRLVALKDKKYELNIIGEDKVEGKKVVGIRVSAKGKKDMNVYFDAETGLLAKLEFRTTDAATGKEVAEERIVLEYGKDKTGVPTAKKVVVKHDGKKFLEAEVLEVTRLETIDDSEFKK